MCGLDLSLHSTLVTHFPCVIYVHPEQARASGAFLVTTKQSSIKYIILCLPYCKNGAFQKYPRSPPKTTSQSIVMEKNFMNKWKV